MAAAATGRDGAEGSMPSWRQKVGKKSAGVWLNKWQHDHFKNARHGVYWGWVQSCSACSLRGSAGKNATGRADVQKRGGACCLLASPEVIGCVLGTLGGHCFVLG